LCTFHFEDMWRLQKAWEVGLRGRSFKTQSDIDRHIEKGFGQGSQELYVPWLRVQDVPSHGRSRKVHGVKVDRLHHLLSVITERRIGIAYTNCLECGSAPTARRLFQ
jgi:hypothetical protein